MVVKTKSFEEVLKEMGMEEEAQKGRESSPL
jgi:hypothetical protein